MLALPNIIEIIEDEKYEYLYIFYYYYKYVASPDYGIQVRSHGFPVGPRCKGEVLRTSTFASA